MPEFEENRIGFCFHRNGVYGSLTNTGFPSSRWFRPMLSEFLHPRNIPLRGSTLRDYYQKYVRNVAGHFQIGGTPLVESDKEGYPCDVSKTGKMEQAWKYFSSLDDPPAPGQDFAASATQSELDTNLQAVSDIGVDPKKKVCKVYIDHYIGLSTVPNPNPTEYPALKCVAAGSTDADGNDGKCQKSGATETRAVAKRIYQFMRDVEIKEGALYKEEQNYRKDILLNNPEPPCLPSLGPLPPQQLRHHNPPTLEGGYCPDNSVCYQDFSDAHDIYDSQCRIKNGATQVLNCHDLTSNLEKCEREYLEKKVNEASDNLDRYGKLKVGADCHYEFEKAVREMDTVAIGKINKYQLLNWLEREVLCDKEENNLECTQAGKCECIGGTCDSGSTGPGNGNGNNGKPGGGNNGKPGGGNNGKPGEGNKPGIGPDEPSAADGLSRISKIVMIGALARIFGM